MRVYIYIMAKQTTVSVKNQNGTFNGAMVVRGDTRDAAHFAALWEHDPFARANTVKSRITSPNRVVLAEVDES
jgi:hypothetical protein